jgi:hypothetical protein
MNKVVDEKFASIIEAVCYWLGYQFKIGREQLIHEASLRYPIADTITSKGVKINRIVLEKLHPIFKSKKIDLVIYNNSVSNPETESDDKRLKEVYEFKLAKSETGKKGSDEHQRVFDDIVRLAYYSKWGKKECYFLMCGKYESFKTYFIGQKNEVTNDGKKNVTKPKKIDENASNLSSDFDKWVADGLYKDWFKFKPGEETIKEFKIHDKANKNEWGLGKFQNSYDIREGFGKKYIPSIKIKTTCMAITPNGLENKRTHAAGLWKIEML